MTSSPLLDRQIQIAQPRFIITLGGEASKRVNRIHLSGVWHQAMHPSAREFKPLATREQRIQLQGHVIKDSIQHTQPDIK